MTMLDVICAGLFVVVAAATLVLIPLLERFKGGDV